MASVSSTQSIAFFIFTGASYSQFFPAQRFSAATFGVRGVRFTMLFPPP